MVLGGDIDLKTAKIKIANIIEKMQKGKASQVKHYDVIKTPKEMVLHRNTTGVSLFWFTLQYERG